MDWVFFYRLRREGMHVPVERKKEIDDDDRGIAVESERTIA